MKKSLKQLSDQEQAEAHLAREMEQLRAILKATNTLLKQQEVPWYKESTFWFLVTGVLVVVGALALIACNMPDN